MWPGCFSASFTAFLVISLNIRRWIVRFFAPLSPASSSVTCHPMASPSRSGSVATNTSLTFCAASLSSLSTFFRLAMTS